MLVRMSKPSRPPRTLQKPGSGPTLTNAKPAKLPQYCFLRGKMIWFTIPDGKGKWVSKSTKFRVGQEEQAARVVRSAHRAMKEIAGRGEKGPMTLSEYIEMWIKDRENRGIASVRDDRARLTKYVIPTLGDMALDEVRPFHVRDLIRELRSRTGTEKRSARTIIHVYRILHTVYQSAVIEERMFHNPIKLERGELPKKSDKDPEWRSRATFTVREVERLISDPLIPVERRVQYAFKAIAGMRHGEVAALCWRHIDYSAEPLARINIVQSYCSHKHVIKSTKTEETRAVPLHPTLAKILAAWKLEHWERVYGRKPTDDDFVVPARTMKPVNAADAGHAMRDDLLALEMRVDAGKFRKRGGHDLRGWYKTRTVEDGAQLVIIRRTTHAPPKDVDGGYERFEWAVICREVAKLRVSILDGKVLPLLTSTLQGEASAANRWRKLATPTGFEAVISTGKSANDHKSSSENHESSDHERTLADTGAARRPYSGSGLKKTAQYIEEALLAGDTPRALRLIRDAAGLTPAVAVAEPVDELQAARRKRSAT